MVYFFLKRLFTWFLIVQYSLLSFAQATGGQVIFELKDGSTEDQLRNNMRMYRLHVREGRTQSNILETKLEWNGKFTVPFLKKDKSFPLKATHKGESLRLTYKSAGDELKFLIDKQGGILIDYIKGKGNFSFFTFGQINLQKTLSAEFLELQGSKISNGSHLNVDELHLEATDETKSKDNLITNHAHGLITAQRKIDVIKGNFNNQGGIRSQGNLVIDMHGNNLTNNDCEARLKGIESSAGLTLVNVGKLNNLAPIKAKALHLSVNSLINGERKNAYKKGIISSQTAEIIAGTLENNLGSKILAISLGHIQAGNILSNKGFIGDQEHNSTWVVESKGNFINDGNVQAEWLTLEALGLLHNNHQIEGRSFLYLSGGSLNNNEKGYLVGQHKIQLSDFGKVDNFGTIKGGAIINLLDLGDVNNQGVIGAGKGVLNVEANSLTTDGAIHSRMAIINIKQQLLARNLIRADNLLCIMAGRVINRATLWGSKVTITTRKVFENHKIIASQHDLKMNLTGTSTNDGELRAGTDIFLRTHGTFTNNKDINLNPDNKFAIDGTGRFTNRATITADHFSILSMDEVRNDGTLHGKTRYDIQFRQSLINKGKIIGNKGNIISIGGKAINHKEIDATNIQVKNLNNHQEGLIHSDRLTVNEGNNEGEIELRYLVLHNLFTNKATLKTPDNLIIEGSGALDNEAEITSPGYLNITGLKKLTNSGTVKARTGTWTINHLNNSKNIIIEEIITLATKTGINSGKLTANDLNLALEEWLINEKLLRAERQLVIKGSGELTNNGTLESKDILNLENLRKLINHADIKGKTGTWTTSDLTNTKAINFTDTLDLRLTTGNNSRDLTANNLTILIHELLTNTGELKAKMALNMQGEGQFINENKVESTNQLTFDALTKVTNAAGKIAGKDVSFVRIGELNNQSEVESHQSLDLTDLQKLTNTGTIEGKTGTWTVHNLTNSKLINLTNTLNLTLTMGNNSDDLTANTLTILIHQLLTNTGELKAITAFTMKGDGEFSNDKTVQSTNQLSFEGLAKVTNTNEIKGNQVDFIAVANLENQATIHSNAKINFRNLVKLVNTPSGVICGNMGLALDSVREGKNEGKVESSGLFSMSNTHFNNLSQAEIRARDGINIDPDSSILNAGLVASKGILSGDLEQTFRQNQGTWSHTGLVDPLSQELQLRGTTAWQIKEVGGQSSQRPLKIINNGEAFFRNGGFQAKGPLQIVNNNKLTLSGAKAQRFQSLINHKGLHLEADTENSYQGWSISSNADQSVSFTPVTKKTVTAIPDRGNTFANNGTIYATKNLYYHLQSRLGQAHIKGDLHYLNHPLSLSDLCHLACEGTIIGKIVGGQYSITSSLSKIKHLHVSCDQPLTLISKLTLPILTINATAPIELIGHLTLPALIIYSTAPITLEKGQDQFAHIKTTEGNLALSAPSITAPAVKLDSAADLDIKTLAGSMKLGDFVEKAPDEIKKLGPWGVGMTVNDHFLPTGENTYRASNGSILNAAGRLNLEGQRLDVSYCALISYLETKITSGMILDLLSVILEGNGDLHIQAPQIKFNFAGTRKAQRANSYQVQLGWGSFVRQSSTITIIKNIIYDYLISEPTKLLHQGEVHLTGQGIDFVGTPLNAKKLYINDKLFNEETLPSSVRLIPIPLGEKDRDHHYKTLTYHKRSGSRWHGHSEVKVERPITFRSVARDLAPKLSLLQIMNLPLEFRLTMSSEIYRGITYNFFGPEPQDVIPGFYGEFSVPNATVAEIDALGRYDSAIWMAKEIQRCHQTGDVFRYWLGANITPKFIYGGAKINAADFQGQVTMDGKDVAVDASTIDLYNNSTRQIDEVLKTLDIDLGSTPQAVFLEFVQNSLGHELLGHRLSPSDLPAVTFMALSPKDKMGQPRGIRLSRLNLHVPVDLVVMAALADHGKRVHYQGMSGEDLLMHVMDRSRRLQQLQYASSTPKALTYEEMAKEHQLTLYAANDNDSDSDEGKVYLHIPAEAQNAYSQPGDLVVEKANLNAANDNTLRDQRLVVGENTSLTGKNVTLESTAKPSVQNDVVTYTPHAPMMVIGSELAELGVNADHNSRLTGTTVKGFSDITNKAGVAAETTALKMANEKTIYEGNKKNYTVEDHHLVTTIESPGTYTETAPEHLHEGTSYQASVNRFAGKKAKAKSVVDYTRTTTEECSGTWWGSTTQTTTHTQTPTRVSQPVYQGVNILDVDSYEGEGSVFQGLTIDKTKLMTLKPAIATALSTFETHSSWLGITSGVKVDQGQEQILQPRIEGEFISKRHEKDAANILRLTSTILDLHKSQIDKDVIKDTYQPKEWYHEEKTGNAPVVATVVSLVVATATWGTGSALAEAFIQNAILQAMATASFVTVCSSTAASMVTHQGDLGKVTRDLFSTDMLKNIALSAATAGVMKGLTTKFPALNTKGELHQRFLYHMIHNSVQLHLDIALNGGSYAKLAKSARLQAAVTAMSGYLSNSIGNLLEAGDINRLTHKLFHGAVGALASTAMGEKPAAGAIGAMVAETTAEIMQDTKLPKLEEKFARKADELRWVSPNGRLSAEQELILQAQFDAAYDHLKNDCANIGRYAAISAAVLAKQNPSAVYNAANTALTENFVKHGLRALRIAGLAISGYEIVDTYRTEGPEAALYKLGEIGLITVAIGAGGQITYEIGGVACKNAVRAWDLACKQYPTLRKMSHTIYQGVGAVKNSRVYQQGTALVDKGVTAVTSSGVYQAAANNKVVQGVGKVIEAADEVVDGAVQLGGQVASKGIKYLTGGGVKGVVDGKTAQLGRNLGTGKLEGKEKERVSVRAASNRNEVQDTGTGGGSGFASGSSSASVDVGSSVSSRSVSVGGGFGGKGSTPKPANTSRDINALDLAKPKGVEITLEFKEGMDMRDFSRKTRALQDLAERGKLSKAPNPVKRNKNITAQYRSTIMKSAEKKYKDSDPIKYQRIKEKMRRMDVDHQHDLQVNGLDKSTNLGLLESFTNQDIGRQIRKQIEKVENGTKIEKIIIKE